MEIKITDKKKSLDESLVAEYEISVNQDSKLNSLNIEKNIEPSNSFEREVALDE